MIQSEKQRSVIISKIYDVVLNPENTNSFMLEWEKYITEVSSRYDNLTNSEGMSEVLIRDEELETHFSRVYAILEKINAQNLKSPLTDVEGTSEVLFRFDTTGKTREQNEDTIGTFGRIKSVADLKAFLDEESTGGWEAFIRNSRRAPSLNRFHIFSMKEHGNLIAFNHREDNSDNFSLVVKLLAVHWTPQLKHLLLTQFSLGKRELELVEALSLQGSLDLIAQNSNRSKNTLRTQMKSIFRKMKVRSQPEVTQSLALLAHFCDVVGYEQPATSSSVELGKTRRIKLPSGVSVPVHFIGPEKGIPVLVYSWHAGRCCRYAPDIAGP